MKKKPKIVKTIKPEKRVVSSPPRKNWKRQFAKALKEDKTADEIDFIQNEFDKTEWTW